MNSIFSRLLSVFQNSLYFHTIYTIIILDSYQAKDPTLYGYP